MNETTETAALSLLAGEPGYDPIEDRLRKTVRTTIEAMFEEELADFIGRCRYGRGGATKKDYRHGHRDRQLVGTFGTETVSVPRARIEDEKGKITEWRSRALPRYQRLTKKAEALIAAPRQAGAVRSVRGRRQQGRGQQGLAEGEGRLGRVVRPQPGR